MSLFYLAFTGHVRTGNAENNIIEETQIRWG